MARVIITGSRSWRCDELARVVVERLVARHGESLVIVHGARSGVEDSFDLACLRLRVEREPCLAYPHHYGDQAGAVRNRQMIARGADKVLAFHSNLKASRGTKDCVRRALEAGIPTWLIVAEDAEPRRVHRLD
jgi:hypothetical protein